MELLGFLPGAIAIALVIAKVIFSSKTKTLKCADPLQTRETTTANAAILGA